MGEARAQWWTGHVDGLLFNSLFCLIQLDADVTELLRQPASTNRRMQQLQMGQNPPRRVEMWRSRSEPVQQRNAHAGSSCGMNSPAA